MIYLLWSITFLIFLFKEPIALLLMGSSYGEKNIEGTHELPPYVFYAMDEF